MRGALEQPEGRAERLRRLWHTVRPLGWRQVTTRARVVLLRRWWRLTGRRAPAGAPLVLHPGPGRAAGATGEPMARRIAEAREALAAIEANTFSFLAERRAFAGEVDWHAPEVSRLWRYHLHYFCYVRELMLADLPGGQKGGEQFRRLALAWLKANELVQGDGWHPYTLSLRMVSWLKAACFWAPVGGPDPIWAPAFGGSLRAQVRLLLAQLEHDVRGNHLFENGRALTWIGLLAQDPEADDWLRRGLGILGEEVPEQIMEDGGHFERCPGYHFSILLSLVELGCLFDLLERPVPGWLTDAVGRMAAFGANILMPDRNYPLLKDSARDQIPVSPRDVLAAAARWLDRGGDPARRCDELRAILYFGFAPGDARAIPRPAALPDAGYCVAHGRDEAVVFDAGRPCPDYLPAHAHADALSFEFHVAGAPLVTDPGIYEYTTGPWRDYFRSTAAHSTVTVDGRNSSDVWSSFRVGRRARVRLLRSERRAGEALWVGEHDGFAQLPGRPMHRRLLWWREGCWLAVLDVVHGAEVHQIESWLHFAPGIQVGAFQQTESGWRADLGTCGWHLFSLGGDVPALVAGRVEPAPQGWHSEAFGVRRPAVAVSGAFQGELPQASGWVIARDPEMRAGLMLLAGGWNLTIDSRLGRDSRELTGFVAQP